MKISICITTKNRCAFLRETLESIRLQTFTDYEVIIWDNGQYANGIVSFFDGRFKYYTQADSDKLNMSEGFSRALSFATGDYILFLSDDDLLYPKSLQSLYREALMYNDDIIIGATDMLHDDIKIAQCTQHKLGTNSCMSSILKAGEVISVPVQHFQQALVRNTYKMYLFWSAALVKREIVISIGGFPNYGTPLMADFAYLLKASGYVKHVTIINTPVCAQRAHYGNNGRNNLIVSFSMLREIFSTYCNDIEGCNKFVSNWITFHCIFLKQYFKRAEITANLTEVMFKCLSFKEIFKVYLGYYAINFLNWIKSKI